MVAVSLANLGCDAGSEIHFNSFDELPLNIRGLCNLESLGTPYLRKVYLLLGFLFFYSLVSSCSCFVSSGLPHFSILFAVSFMHFPLF